MNYNQFVKICKFNQSELKKYVFKKLRKTHDNIVWGDGFVYAKGTFPVMLVAHLDTVHALRIKTIERDEKTGKISSPQGIGGDDRCGVYMILDIVKKYNCSVLFCEDEETGGKGATKFIASKYADGVDVKYIIELDRKGATDAVFYDCDNPDFTKFICENYFTEAYGSFSDISILAPDLGVAAVNLSSGYYNAHTTTEYVMEYEIADILAGVYDILDRTGDTKYEYIERERTWSRGLIYGTGAGASYNGYDGYDEYDDDVYEAYEVEYISESGETDYTYIWAFSENSATLKFLMQHPKIPYGDITCITNYGDIGGWYR